MEIKQGSLNIVDMKDIKQCTGEAYLQLKKIMEDRNSWRRSAIT